MTVFHIEHPTIMWRPSLKWHSCPCRLDHPTTSCTHANTRSRYCARRERSTLERGKDDWLRERQWYSDLSESSTACKNNTATHSSILVFAEWSNTLRSISQDLLSLERSIHNPRNQITQLNRRRDSVSQKIHGNFAFSLESSSLFPGKEGISQKRCAEGKGRCFSSRRPYGEKRLWG